MVVGVVVQNLGAIGVELLRCQGIAQLALTRQDFESLPDLQQRNVLGLMPTKRAAAAGV